MSTIAAIATAASNGGIGIIRISGKKSFSILDKIFKAFKPSENRRNFRLYYEIWIYYKPRNKRENIDEVLVSYFKEPKSYTTENMCEINNSHGGIVIEHKKY